MISPKQNPRQEITLYCVEDRDTPFIDVFKKTANRHGYNTVFPGTHGARNPRYEKFKSVYHHMSVNPADFELACFRRYFVLLDVVKPGERFVVSDTDLFMNASSSMIPKDISDFSHGVVGSIGVTNGVMESDIGPHFSFWTTELLQQFVEYLIYSYEERADDLALNFEQRKLLKGNRVAISDMTLLYNWITTQKIPFYNANQVIDGVYLDHNVNMVECHNSTFKGEFGRKRIYFGAEGLTLRGTDGQAVRPLFLHLQGRYKAISRMLDANARFSTYLASMYISIDRTVRSFLLN